MIPSSNCRYKYGNLGGWTPAGTEEAQSPPKLHPESPSTGKHWMSQTISFSRLKLTNNTNNDSSTYQNEQVPKLKIDNNPLAKGFRRTGGLTVREKDKTVNHKAKKNLVKNRGKRIGYHR
ncbi:T-box-containing protein TBX6L-like [Leptinotarsa decemlineata]|uniref:T-box-containing protein TBX6L-like n=1 Tax=Leptinotarsa decemlineata TaxID=7539 RepID=UPI003D304F4B